MSSSQPTSKQLRLIWTAITGLAIATIIALVVTLFWGLGKVVEVLSPVLWPLAIAAVVACLLDPLVVYLERNKVTRTRAIILVFVGAFVLVAGVVGSVVPQLVVETSQLGSKIPSYATNVQVHVEHWINNPPAFIREMLEQRRAERHSASISTRTIGLPDIPTTNAPATESTNTVVAAAGSLLAAFDSGSVDSVTSWIARVLSKIGTWVLIQMSRIGTWFEGLIGLILVPIYAFFFLQEKRRIAAHWHDYLPVIDSAFKHELVYVLGSINEYLVAFFRGQVLVALCDGVLYTIGFVIIGLPYSILMGVLATVLTIIPFIGAVILCVIALMLAVVNFGDWLHPLWVILVFGVVVTLENTLIAPKIMGHRVNLHPVLIIIALMTGTTLLGGLLGGILAIPLAAVLRVVMFRYVWKRRVP